MANCECHNQRGSETNYMGTLCQTLPHVTHSIWEISKRAPKLRRTAAGSHRWQLQTYLGLSKRWMESSTYWCVLRREWMGMDGLLGVAGMIIDSEPVDHSRKFPA